MNIMPIKSLLGFARSMGYKNISELQGLKRAIKAGNTTGKCHLEVDSKVQEYAQQFAKSTDDQKTTAIINFTRTYFPQAYAQDAKEVLDVAYKRLSEKSGIVKMVAKSTDSSGNELSSGTLKILGNSTGGRVTANVTSNYGIAGKYDISCVPSAFKRENTLELLKGLKYNEANGISNISLPQTQVRGLRAGIDVSAPSPYVNTLTGIISDYNYTNFGQLLSKLG